MKTFNLTDILNVPGLPKYLSLVDDALNRILLKDNNFINEPLKRIFNSGGKRLRPALIISIVIAGGKKVDEKVINACAAIELVHLSSLIHDDIIDHSSERWGQPTIVFKEGLNVAILVGDYLLSKAGELASSVNGEVGEITSRAAAILCDGQSREIVDSGNIERSIDSLLSSIKGKTCSLFSAACEIGIVCSSGNAQQRSAMLKFAEAYGIGFQLIDDVMDQLSSESLLRKQVDNDINEGIYTMPLIMALSSDQTSQLRKAVEDKDKEYVKKYLIDNGYMQTALEEIRKYNLLAKNALKDFPRSFEKLANLPDEYYNWAVGNLIQEKYLKLIV